MVKKLRVINFTSTQKQHLYRIYKTANRARWAVAAVFFFVTSPLPVNKIHGEIESAQAQAPNTSILKSHAFLLNQSGGEQLKKGKFREALEIFQELLGIYKKIGDRAGEGRTLNSIATVYNILEQYGKALKFYEQALAIHKELGDKKGEGVTLNGTASVYRSLRQYAQALKFYEQAIAIYRELGEPEKLGNTLNNMAGVYSSLSLDSQAVKLYEEALVIAQKAGNKIGQSVILNNMGSTYQTGGKYAQALQFYQQALIAIKAAGDQGKEGTILNNIGYVYNLLGEYERSEKILFEAIAIWDALRVGMIDADRVSNFEQQADTYGFLQTALVAQQKTDRALEIAERGRARAFVELLTKKQSENPKNQLTVKPPTISQIKQIAKEQNATLIEYSVIRSRELYIWVIQPTGKIAFRRSNFTNIDASLGEIAEVTRVAAATKRGLPQSDSILTDFVRDTRLAVGAETRAANSNSTRCRGKKCLQQMYRLLIEPIADLLPANPESKIIFIPHQSLFLVPFPALQDAEGKYSIEKHTILTAPAIQILQLTRTARQRRREINQQQWQGKDVLIVGNPEMPLIGDPPRQLGPLPGSEQEAIAIAQILNTKALIGKEATETLIKQLMLDAKIIHLATHGLLNELKENEVPGAIALAASQTDNGLLTSSEILDLRLQAELVVLSACNTGRGRITGDSVMGLSRSLMTAGATSVVVSLWSVPDAPTSLLMMEFYRQMQANPDKAQALRQAMLTVAKKYPGPGNWAAFTLMGESE